MRRLESEVQPPHGRRAVFRTGAVCAIVGTAAFFVAGALHGGLTVGGNFEVAFRHVAERPYWSAIHLLGYIFGVLLWLVAFVALSRTFTISGNGGPGISALVGRLTVAFMTVGSTIAVLQFATDGYVLPRLAESWATASGAERESIVRMGEIFQTLVREPLFAGEVAFCYGLPFALAGLGVALNREYPGWFGWVGVLVGGSVFIYGATSFVGLALIPETILWAALMPLEWLWTIALGVLMWRRADGKRPSRAQ